MFTAHYRLPIFVPTMASMCEGCPIQCEVFAFTGVTQGCSFLLITYTLHDSDSASLNTIEISLEKKGGKYKGKSTSSIGYQNGIHAGKSYTSHIKNGCALLICISKGWTYDKD